MQTARKGALGERDELGARTAAGYAEVAVQDLVLRQCFGQCIGVVAQGHGAYDGQFEPAAVGRGGKYESEGGTTPLDGKCISIYRARAGERELYFGRCGHGDRRGERDEKRVVA